MPRIGRSFPVTPLVTGFEVTLVTFRFDQDSFLGREDDGTETTATSIAAINNNWTQLVNVNFRPRFLIQETGTTAIADRRFQLQYNLNSEGWNDVTGSSSVVKASLSDNFADGDVTTEQMAGAGAFVAGEMDEVNGDAGDISAGIDFGASNDTEVEYCCQIVGGDVADTDTIELRVIERGVALDSYTNTPTVTVNKPSSGILPFMNHYLSG